MRKPIVILLVTFLLFNSRVYAYAFDAQKLLELKPLLTERLRKQVGMAQVDKQWPALVAAVTGLQVILNNTNDETVRMANMAAGGLILTTGLIVYYSKTTPQMNTELLESISPPGIEREKNAYMVFKKNAELAQLARETSVLVSIGTGLCYGLASQFSPNASNSTRTVFSVAGLVMFGIGLMQYLYPSPSETEMNKIDDDLRKIN